MTENTRKKRKLHDSALEIGKTVKGIFKKDDLDDSLSVSDWGLGDDTYKHRRRERSLRFGEVTLVLICEWNACYEDFSDYDVYISHLKKHLEDFDALYDKGTLKCFWTDCSYIAFSIPDLNQHVCFHGYHTKLKSVGKNVENHTTLPKCTQTEHFTIPVVPGGYQCEWEYCDKVFNLIYDFHEHMKIHVFHNPKGSKEGIIRCCWKGCTSTTKFSWQYKLAEHLRKHTKEKLLACPTCGNLFTCKTKFCDHRRRQLPIDMQSYLCSQCLKYFPSERLLRDHMRLHINHYKCSMCEMTCPKPSILAKHIRCKHLNEKPFKCTVCNYKCVSKQNLELHLKTHDAEDQFKCSDCDFKCRSSFGLERHCQKAHGKEWANIFECHNCKKQFIRGGHLTRHLMKVHNYHWPSGHSRFRYKEDPDGIHRLQTVRYETLDVTQEIISGKKIQEPTIKESYKVSLLKSKDRDSTSIDTFEVVLKKNELKRRKKVLITINDVDSDGNVVKSKTVQSTEVVCPAPKKRRRRGK